MEANSEKYIPEFIRNVKEKIIELNLLLDKLEENMYNHSLISIVFRIVHTIKGMSAMIEYNQVTDLMHAAEDLLNGFIQTKPLIDIRFVNLLRDCLDMLETLVFNLENNEVENFKAYESLIKRLKAYSELEGLNKKNKPTSSEGTKGENILNERVEFEGFNFSNLELKMLKDLQDQDYKIWRVDFTLSKKCIDKSIRVFLILRDLEDLGSLFKVIPDINNIEKGLSSFNISSIFITQYDKDSFSDSLENASEIDAYYINEIKKEELLSLINKPSLTTSNSSTTNQNKSKRQDYNNQEKDKKVEVNLYQMQVLTNLVNELSLIKDEFIKSKNDNNSAKNINLLENKIKEINLILSNLRTVPIQNIFNNLELTVKHASRKLNKKVELKTVIPKSEIRIEVEKVEKIKEILLHLIRNSVDHGIEDIQERLSVGKPETSQIRLKIYKNKKILFIEVKDDGSGINIEKIKRRLCEKKLVNESDLIKMTRKEIFQYLFEYGFSTASQVSDISGRGVGLNVVRNNLSELNGYISIDSRTGIGTVFKISLAL